MRPPKKTDVLEVRLPHAAKQAFMAKARGEGRTASAVLRGFIEAYLADGSQPEVPMLKRFAKPALATSLAASALALYALTPTAVAAAPDLKAIFDQLDRDGDGMLSADEFLAPRDGDVFFVRHDAAATDRPQPFVVPLRNAAHPPLADGARPADARAILRETFAAQDRDRNGTVSFGEFESHHLAMLREGFDAIDSNRNGVLERAEYTETLGRLPGAPDEKLPFEEADRDGDGRISWSEFLG